MSILGTARRVANAVVAAVRVLTRSRPSQPRRWIWAGEGDPGAAPTNDYREWIWADDADPSELGELNRRWMRDNARRMIDREAASITRGELSRDLAWIAQEIPNGHPLRAAVRARARFAHAPLKPEYPSDLRARLLAQRKRTAQQIAGLRREIARATARTLRIVHALAVMLALRVARAWQRPCAPRAPAPTRLA